MSELYSDEEYQKRQREAWLEYDKKHHPIEWNDLQKSNIIMHYESRKSEFRCEKMLLFHLLDILFFR